MGWEAKINGICDFGQESTGGQTEYKTRGIEKKTEHDLSKLQQN